MVAAMIPEELVKVKAVVGQTYDRAAQYFGDVDGRRVCRIFDFAFV